MSANLPCLSILSVDKLLPHEYHDEQRVLPLIERLRNDGILRNPPIVAPLHDPEEHYVVLDGANRTAAFQAMNIPHILTQVVEPDDRGLRLRTWNHVIFGIAQKQLLAYLRETPSLEWQADRTEQVNKDRRDIHSSARLHLPDGKRYVLCTTFDGAEQGINLLSVLVDCYKGRVGLDRTTLQSVEALIGLYPDLGGLLEFPYVDIKDVLHLAGCGRRIPAGITRFTISPRTLRVNYPMAELEADEPLVEKNATLKEWIKARVARRGVRFYEETTFLFDE